MSSGELVRVQVHEYVTMLPEVGNSSGFHTLAVIRV